MKISDCEIFLFYSVSAVLSREEEESVEDFTSRVQRVMASSLQISVTPHTSADKVEYAKRKLLESAQQNNATGIPICLH